MDRIRPLDPPHKGLRNVLGALSLAAGRTEFGDPGAVAELQELGRHAWILLRDHARLEDVFIFDRLERAVPGATAETTRNAIAGGLLALLEHPEQFERLRAEPALLPSAIEEMVRWTTPSPSKRRTATARTSLGGATIEPGQKVVIWEGSANRDAAVFEEPMAFDIGRDPNPHIGFGHGIHYCLGANLARIEARVLFEELLARVGTCELVSEPEWTRSNRHTGIRSLVVRFTPA